MLRSIHENRRVQLLLGLVMGVCFGFFLQKGQVTKYDVIMEQLLLRDFTVMKVILSAIATGMIGIYALKGLGLVQLHPKPGSLGSSVVGGLIFGIGFAILGYCPGTAAGAIGQGSMDALLGGVTGMLIGSSIFVAIYPKLAQTILKMGDFGKVTIPQLLDTHPVKVVLSFCAAILAIFLVLELFGL